MMKKLLMAFLGLILSLGAVYSQGNSGELKGTVKDGAGAPVPFANVAVYRGSQLITGGVANIDGEYSIKPITSGTYEVEFSSVGYEKTRVTNVEIGGLGKITFL